MGQLINIDFRKANLPETVVSKDSAEIIDLFNSKGDDVFTIETATERLKIVFAVTKRTKAKVDALIDRLDNLPAGQNEIVSQLETEVNYAIQSWQNQLAMLGAKPQAFWTADFDSGDGYFCWKFPERKIEFWHKYTEGLGARRRIGETTNFKNIKV